jgi:glycosyltransferase involved in cell wall biosynthesis
MNSVSVVIPARNERGRIGWVIRETQKYADEVIVVDDASTDGTRQLAEKLGAKVVPNNQKRGYIGAIKTGFEKARGDIVVTLDADGEHAPQDIIRLIQPIVGGKVDLVLGKRERIPRISERFINWLTNLKVKVGDSGTGFRAMRRDLALKLNLPGKCTCGIFVLEASCYGGKICEVPITLRSVTKERKMAWSHFWQTFYILRWLLGGGTG